MNLKNLDWIFKSLKLQNDMEQTATVDGEVCHFNNDRTAIAWFCDQIFTCWRVESITWNGLKWKSWSTVWRDRRESDNTEWDPDCKCTGYWHCDYQGGDGESSDCECDDQARRPLIEPKKVEKIEDIRHNFVSADCRNNGNWVPFIVNNALPGQPPYMVDFTEKKGLNNTLFRLDSTWVVMNDNDCLNEDHRGSNHMGIEFDHLFNGTIEIPAGTYTGDELGNLLWRVKGNKFDNQYEMYLRFIIDDRVRIREIISNIVLPTDQDNKTYVTLRFDHGS